MTKIEFKNLPDTSTPLNAENLNALQDNVETAIGVVENEIPTLDSSVSTSSTNGVENQAITNYVDSEIGDVENEITTINGKLQDSGWIDMSNYINTTYFAPRPNHIPKVRKIGKVCYWQGAVYCHTNVGGNQATLFSNLPNEYVPSYEQAGGGVHFPTNNTYKMFFSSSDIFVNDGNNYINASQDWEGYTMSDIGSYIVD